LALLGHRQITPQFTRSDDGLFHWPHKPSLTTWPLLCPPRDECLGPLDRSSQGPRNLAHKKMPAQFLERSGQDAQVARYRVPGTFGQLDFISSWSPLSRIKSIWGACASNVGPRGGLSRHLGLSIRGPTI
jgi:hypothetical protein